MDNRTKHLQQRAEKDLSSATLGERSEEDGYANTGSFLTNCVITNICKLIRDTKSLATGFRAQKELTIGPVAEDLHGKACSPLSMRGAFVNKYCLVLVRNFYSRSVQLFLGWREPCREGLLRKCWRIREQEEETALCWISCHYLHLQPASASHNLPFPTHTVTRFSIILQFKISLTRSVPLGPLPLHCICFYMTAGFLQDAPSFSAGGGRSAMRSGHALRTTCQVSKNLERN